MNIDSKLLVWVEYCLCEALMDVYPTVRRYISTSSSLSGFCKRMQFSLNNANLYSNPLNSVEDRVLRYMIFRAKREYRVPDDKLAQICADFFIDEKWEKYMKVIKLMDEVNYRL